MNALVKELVEKKSGNIDLDDMKRIMHDTVDSYALKKMRDLATIFEKDQVPPWLRPYLSTLKVWNGDFLKTSTEPTLFTLLEYNIFKVLLKKQIPDENLWIKIMSRYEGEDFQFNFYSSLIEDPSRH